jgi:signal transduction histidine kinase
MSLRARLRLAIVALVALVVTGLSALYLFDFTRASLDNASNLGRNIANNAKGYMIERFTRVLSGQPAPPSTPAGYKQAWTEIVRTDPLISAMLQRSRANADMVANVAIAGQDGRILAASDPSTIGLPTPTPGDAGDLDASHTLRGLLELFTTNRNYVVTLPLGVQGDPKPVFTISVVIDSIFLRHALRPAFYNLGLAFLIALLVSMLLGFALPNLALRPLERVSRRIDEIRSGHFAPTPPPSGGEAREFADVQSKLTLLGQQVHGARQDALNLRGNLDRMLERLQETVLLFDSAGRLTVAGHLAETLFARPRSELLGRSVEELFPPQTTLGAAIAHVRASGGTIENRVFSPAGLHPMRLLVNAELLGEPGAPSGLLIRLSDAESRTQLERHLDLASRLAAIGRLTGGVAHEIKNPLNAITLHLEVLKTKLDDGGPEIGVILNEVRRLDRVVKTFLDFSRPVELQVRELDLASLARQTAAFLEPQAAAKSASIDVDLPLPLPVRGDAELLRQALINVIVNALDAIPSGGRVRISSAHDSGQCALTISDNGPGVPPEIRSKIFHLYFSTKTGGSGIGLAMTFRLIQLHGGTIELSDEPGPGATFRIRLPEATLAGDTEAPILARG